MRELPAEGSSWSANLPAGLLSCFGQGEAKGVLPVNIPVLDEAYQPTEEILWPRGYTAAGADTQAPADASAAEDENAEQSDGTLDRVVILSRHNIRSPLSGSGSMLGDITPHEWFR